jgi:hypothetical protein
MRTINIRAAKKSVVAAQAIVEPAILYTADQQLVGYSDLIRRIGASGTGSAKST